MKELLINEINTIKYNLLVGGVATAASNVSVVLKDANNNVVTTGSVVNSSTGIYTAMVNPAATQEEKKLIATWSFTVNSFDMTVEDEYSVVTPYASFSDFIGEYNIQYKDFVECERAARYIINGYCGQAFGKEQNSYTALGRAEASLRLPKRIIDFQDITNLDLPYDYGTDYTGIVYPQPWPRPANVIGFDVSATALIVTADGWLLRANHPDPFDVIHYDRALFRRNAPYVVTGVWGWETVPSEVAEAAQILVADLLCQDHKYRDRYLQSIKIGQTSMTFAVQAWQGTGNAMVDSLLLDYRLNPGIGVI